MGSRFIPQFFRFFLSQSKKRAKVFALKNLFSQQTLVLISDSSIAVNNCLQCAGVREHVQTHWDSFFLYSIFGAVEATYNQS